MKHIWIIVLSISLLLSLGVNCWFFFTDAQSRRVASVNDGDTFTLSDGQKIRLLGLNAPELGLCGSEESKTRLSELIEGKSVHITEGKYDQFNRKMALVRVSNILVNEVLLKEGWARADYTPNSKSDRLKNAYREATEKSLGIHSALCKSLAPTPKDPSCTIKSNIDKATGTRYFHLPKCRHYNQIVLDADLGEQFFCTEQEAKKAGFTLAPDCLR